MMSSLGFNPQPDPPKSRVGRFGNRASGTAPALRSLRSGLRAELHGLGAASFGQPTWWRVYEQSSFAGWAWATPSDIALFGNSCGNVMRGQAQGGFWETLFGARNPAYQGAASWFQIWHKPTQSFIGWYMLGYHSAKKVRLVCPHLEVFTSQGQAI